MSASSPDRFARAMALSISLPLDPSGESQIAQ
jgi:hypothetical protein